MLITVDLRLKIFYLLGLLVKGFNGNMRHIIWNISTQKM